MLCARVVCDDFALAICNGSPLVIVRRSPLRAPLSFVLPPGHLRLVQRLLELAEDAPRRELPNGNQVLDLDTHLHGMCLGIDVRFSRVVEPRGTHVYAWLDYVVDPDHPGDWRSVRASQPLSTSDLARLYRGEAGLVPK